MTSSTGTNPRAAGLVARERLERHGVNTLSDAELLAIAHFTRALDGAEEVLGADDRVDDVAQAVTTWIAETLRTTSTAGAQVLFRCSMHMDP